MIRTTWTQLGRSTSQFKVYYRNTKQRTTSDGSRRNRGRITSTLCIDFWKRKEQLLLTQLSSLKKCKAEASRPLTRTIRKVILKTTSHFQRGRILRRQRVSRQRTRASLPTHQKLRKHQNHVNNVKANIDSGSVRNSKRARSQSGSNWFGLSEFVSTVSKTDTELEFANSTKTRNVVSTNAPDIITVFFMRIPKKE